MGDPAYKLQSSFNKLDQSNSYLNMLLPAVETDWPDNYTLTQILMIVPGAPSDVERRAAALVDRVPVATMSSANPPA